MRVLVLGGTGFIGASTVRKLAALGDSVVCFDRAIKPDQFADRGDRVSVVSGDVTRIEEIWATIRDHQIERIVNLAYLLAVPSERAPHGSTVVNILGMSNVFEAARLSGIRRVVYASSIAVHGVQDQFGERPVTEADYGLPFNLYGAQKALNEFLGRSFNRRYRMEIAGLRIAVVYGPGRERGFTGHNHLITEPALGRPVSVPFSPKALMSLIYMGDVAEALVRMVRADRLDHQVYQSGGHLTSIGELADLVRAEIPDAQITLEDRVADLSAVYQIDSRRIRDELGFQLSDLRATIRETIAETRRLAGR